MTFWRLPLSGAAHQRFRVALSPAGLPLQALIDLRYLPATDSWVISITDDASGELLINRIPLVASYGPLNDLLLPFRHLRDGHGLGSLVVISGVEHPSTPDPAKDSLGEFFVLWGAPL